MGEKIHVFSRTVQASKDDLARFMQKIQPGKLTVLYLRKNIYSSFMIRNF